VYTREFADLAHIAYSQYHEMYAHIDSKQPTELLQHKEYGNFYSGLKLYYPKVSHSDTTDDWPVQITDQLEWNVPKGSPYYRIRKQLLEIKNAKKGK
jgi:hypothetical protein